MRLVVMFDNFGPYHRPRLQAACRRGEEEGIEVRGLETFGDSFEYSWTCPVPSSEGGNISLFPAKNSNFEQWGLVVNEAMASGLPVLVSRACGCAPELVREEVNGFTFDPGDAEGLARLMLKMTSPGVDLRAMGAASARLIADWTPETFARNLFEALKATDDYCRRVGFC